MSSLTAPPAERDAAWDEVRTRLRGTLNNQTYKFAFAGARPLALDEAASCWPLTPSCCASGSGSVTCRC